MNEPTDQEIKESMFSLLNQLEITIKEEIKPIDQQFNGSDQCLAHVEFNQPQRLGDFMLRVRDDSSQILRFPSDFLK